MQAMIAGVQARITRLPKRVAKENSQVVYDRSWYRSTVVVLLFVAGSVGTATAEDKPIRALLVIGGCCHDYAAQKDLLTQGISARANVTWTIAYDPDKTTSHMNPVYENPDWAAGFDVVVHDECSSDVKDLAVIERILRPHREGLPAVVLHCGMHCYRSQGYPKEVTPWFEFTGLPSTGHGPQLPIEVTLIDRDSPILHGLDNWTTINEELYNNFIGNVLPTARVFARRATREEPRRQGEHRRFDRCLDQYIQREDESLRDDPGPQ